MSAQSNFRAKGFVHATSKTGEYRTVEIMGVYPEPVDAVEEAEKWLRSALPGSYAEVYFNGDTDPHYRMWRLKDGQPALRNTDAVKWPIFYKEFMSGKTVRDTPSDDERGITDLPDTMPDTAPEPSGQGGQPGLQEPN